MALGDYLRQSKKKLILRQKMMMTMNMIDYDYEDEEEYEGTYTT